MCHWDRPIAPAPGPGDARDAALGAPGRTGTKGDEHARSVAGHAGHAEEVHGMNCAAAREAVLDCARDVPMADDVRLVLEEHLGGCAKCAAGVGWQRDLAAAFRGLSAEARAWNASSTIEDRLHEAFAARVAATPR